MTPLLKDIIKLAENQEAADFSYLWAGLSCIAAQLARNVYIPFGNGKIYPNLYVMFVGDPGKRKSTAIKDLKKRIKAAGYQNICGDKVTMQKYLLDLAGVGEGSIEDSNITEFNLGITLGANDYVESYINQDEFSDFIGINNYPFISLLGNFWDIDEPYVYRTKNGQSIEIPSPIVNILGATTPSQFNTIFPPAISEQGFLSRLIIVNIPESKRKIARPLPSDANVIEKVVDGLKAVRKLSGELVMSDAVWAKLEEIYLSWQPVEDTRFAHYSTRRHTQLLKLCILSTCSRYTIEMSVDDVVFANTLLSFTEHFMPQALGQFGKNKDGDVNSKVISYLRSSFPTAKSLQDIIIPISTETDVLSLQKILTNLVVAEKVVATSNGKYLPKLPSYKDIKTSHVDWNMLGSIVESKFI